MRPHAKFILWKGKTFNFKQISPLILLNKKFLLADDDVDDAFIFCEALTRVASVMECQTVENGMALFEALANNDVSNPDIIFLDINMPVMNGWDCLKKLKNNSAYQSIPIVIYSTSSARKDIETAYNLGALVFVTKPENFEELYRILEVIATSAQHEVLLHLKGFQSVKLN